MISNNIWLARIYNIFKGMIITCLGTMFSAFCLLFIIFGLISYNRYINYEEKLQSKAFNKDTWKLNHYLHGAQMYNDLIQNYIKVGMIITDLKKLLGNTKYRRIYKDKICIEYDLGLLGDGLTHTSFSLIICPDKTGELVESIKLIGGHYGYFDKGKLTMIDDDGNLRLLPDND